MILSHPTTRAFVLLRDVETGESHANELVPHAEADPNRGRLSVDSPIGRALAAARIGSTFDVDTLAGPRRLQLVSADHQFEW
jgi:transcription elongation GreA/GreB family factor